MSHPPVSSSHQMSHPPHHRSHAPRPAAVRLPSPSPSSSPSHSRPPLHQSPRPPHQHFDVVMPSAITLPSNHLFSPRPNAVYTPISKIDVVPQAAAGKNEAQYRFPQPHQIQHQNGSSGVDQAQTTHVAMQQYQSQFHTAAAAPTSLSDGSLSPAFVPQQTLNRRPAMVHENDHFSATTSQHSSHYHSNGNGNGSTHAQAMHQQHQPHGSPSTHSRTIPASDLLPSSTFNLHHHSSHDDDDDAHSSTGKDRDADLIYGFDSSMRSCVFNLCNFILGSGIVSLPNALVQGGVVCGVLLLCLQSFITSYSLRLLIGSGIRMRVYDYEDLLRTLFGKRGWQIGMASIFLLDFGVMITFLVVIADTFTPVFDALLLTWQDDNGGGAGAGSREMISRSYVLCAISLLTILPLSATRSLKSMGWISMLSVMNVCIIVLLVGWKFLVSLFTGTSDSSYTSSSSSSSSLDPSVSLAPFTFLGSNFFKAFGSISFVFVCHDASFAVYQSLHAPSQNKWNRVVNAAVSGALVPSLLIALTGYFLFGERSRSNILNNFAEDDDLVNIARIALGSSMILTYPLNLFMCRHILMKLMRENQHQQSTMLSSSASSSPASSSSSHHSSSPSPHHLPLGTHLLLTVLLFLGSLFIALTVSDLGYVQSFVGGLAGSMLAFILPAAAALRTRQMLDGREWLDKENAAPLALLALAIVIMCVSMYQTFFGGE